MFNKHNNKPVTKKEKLIMIKPIQATPTLSGVDAQQIIAQVQIKPSAASIERNKRMLEVRRKLVVQK